MIELNVKWVKLKINLTWSILIMMFQINIIALGQQISGTVTEMNGDIPVEFVNIGIVGKNVGTVSDRNGKYTLQVNPKYQDDTLRFSSIGYRTYSVKVSDFLKLNNGNVSFEKMTYDITEVVVRPQKVNQKILGITTKNKSKKHCILSTANNSCTTNGGLEFGVIIRNNETVFINEININLAKFSFDSISFRINIYQPDKHLKFTNILRNPVLHSVSEQEIVKNKNKITVDVRHHNIVLDGDFLVTFELLASEFSTKDDFLLCFCTSLFSHPTTYTKFTSQGTWWQMPHGISISVLVDVEK